MINMIERAINHKINNIIVIEYIKNPICCDCKYSRYKTFIRKEPICLALGNKETSTVFNTKECRAVFQNEREPWKRLRD